MMLWFAFFAMEFVLLNRDQLPSFPAGSPHDLFRLKQKISNNDFL